MENSELVFLCAKIVLGGISAFLAVILWNRTGEASWISMSTGIILAFAGKVWELLERIGVFSAEQTALRVHPVAETLFCVIPCIFIIISLALLIRKTVR